MSATLLNQIALVAGFIAAGLLAFSAKVGVISNDGSIIFDGLDPMDRSELNVKRVKSSHRRNKYFTPIGWFLLTASFALQLWALAAQCGVGG